MAEQLRVVLAEDGELVRAGILSLFEGRDDVTVAAVATSLPTLLEAVEAVDPDVVLTDVRMPPDLTDEGIRAAAHLRETHPRLGVLVLTQYADVEYALDLVRLGSHGRGYLLKERVADVDHLVRALHEVAAGGSVIDEVMVQGLVRSSARHEHSGLERLTPREIEVLALVARGLSNLGIARDLVVTERAVEKHIGSIFAKLNLPAEAPVHRRVAATLVFLSDVGQRTRPGERW